jgi:hypothetical protein
VLKVFALISISRRLLRGTAARAN